MTRVLKEWLLGDLGLTRDVTVAVEFRPRDAAVGVRWEAEERGYYHCSSLTRLERRYDLWVCLLPCLPIRLSWLRPATEPGRPASAPTRWS